MKYQSVNGNIEIIDADSFIVSQTLECGQCFRFDKIADEDYAVIAFDRAIRVKGFDQKVVLYGVSENDFKEIWLDYFDLERDYQSIKQKLSNDETLKKSVEYGSGIRILNQDFFECLISFIISQNNRIPMIKNVIKNISKKYGEHIGSVGGEDYYSFPSCEQLLNADCEGLRECRTGFRDKYIIDAVSKIADGTIDIKAIKDMETPKLRETLMKIKGVGPKVADCVMLFSCRRSEVFPTDVWVKRVMSELYFGGEEQSIKNIHSKAYELFGNYAGFAQQYLFYYARDNKIGA